MWNMYAMIAIKIRSVKGNRLLVVIIWAKIAIPQLLKKTKKTNQMIWINVAQSKYIIKTMKGTEFMASYFNI